MDILPDDWSPPDCQLGSSVVPIELVSSKVPRPFGEPLLMVDKPISSVLLNLGGTEDIPCELVYPGAILDTNEDPRFPEWVGIIQKEQIYYTRRTNFVSVMPYQVASSLTETYDTPNSLITYRCDVPVGHVVFIKRECMDMSNKKWVKLHGTNTYIEMSRLVF
jgi:hypothetical protein